MADEIKKMYKGDIPRVLRGKLLIACGAWKMHFDHQHVCNQPHFLLDASDKSWPKECVTGLNQMMLGIRDWLSCYAARRIYTLQGTRALPVVAKTALR